MGIILIVLQYRFLSCSYSVGHDVDIGGDWAKMLGSKYRSSMWHGNALVNRNIDMFNITTLFAIQSSSPFDLPICNLLICDLLNTNTCTIMRLGPNWHKIKWARIFLCY